MQSYQAEVESEKQNVKNQTSRIPKQFPEF